MQSHLLKQPDNKYQAFPGRSWAKEFELASKLGIENIEWIVDDASPFNPIFSEQGIKSILQESHLNKVKVPLIIADFFLETPSSLFEESSWDLLEQITEAGSKLAVSAIEIPLLEGQSSMTEEELGFLSTMLANACLTAEKAQVKLSIKTTLESKYFFHLKKAAPQLLHSVDLANYQALGLDPLEILKELLPYCLNIHIKDGKFQSESLPLGKGDVAFPQILAFLEEKNFEGFYCLQAARYEDGQELLAVEDYLKFIEGCYVSCT